MRLLLVAALVLAVFALIVAAGGTFVTTWPVWVCGSLVAYFGDLLVGDRVHT